MIIFTASRISMELVFNNLVVHLCVMCTCTCVFLVVRNYILKFVFKINGIPSPLEFKGKWPQNFLSSHLTETPKQNVKVYYRIFISALFGEIF